LEDRGSFYSCITIMADGYFFSLRTSLKLRKRKNE